MGVFGYHAFGVALFLVCHWSAQLKSLKHPILVSSIFSTLASLFIAIAFQMLGDTWSIGSIIGKCCAAVIGILVPIMASALTARLLQNRRRRIIYTAASISGLAASLFAPLIWLHAIIFLTGDAL
jgi:uncharacterized integral membrane protein